LLDVKGSENFCQELLGVLDDVYYTAQEPGRIGSVEDPVVEGEREVGDVADLYLAVSDDGAQGGDEASPVQPGTAQVVDLDARRAAGGGTG